MTAVYAVVPVPAKRQAVEIGHQKPIKGDAMNNNRPIARSNKRFATLFLAGAAAVAALGAGPSLAQADRYDRGRDDHYRDIRNDRFRDNRVDVRVGERDRVEERRGGGGGGFRTGFGWRWWGEGSRRGGV